MNKALHIMYEYGTQGVGGAAAAATRLHLDMVARGVDSRVACVWGGESKWEWNAGVGDGVRRVLCLRTRLWWLGVRILHAVTRRWTHALALPGFERVLRGLDPEEVHVHWIRRDTISWRQLREVEKVGGCGRRKLFVHLHDLWALDQPQIVALKPTFVAYSDYVAGIVRAKGYAVERRNLILDPVFTKKDPHSTVPLPLETPTAPPPPPLPLKTPTILFGCKDGRSNPDKGFAGLEKALSLLSEEVKAKVVLTVFGESAPTCLTSGVRTEFLGRIDDPVRLKALYQEAACFAFPSTSETMGMTKLEALACGCPVVAFNRTACAEGIDHLRTGYVARDNDLADYANGLLMFLK